MSNDFPSITTKIDEHHALLARLWQLPEKATGKRRHKQKSFSGAQNSRNDSNPQDGLPAKQLRTQEKAPSEDASNAALLNRLQSSILPVHTEDMVDEIDNLRRFLKNSPLVKGLSDDEKASLKKVNLDFIAATQMSNVVPLLINVPKSTIDVGGKTAFIPLESLPNEDARSKRRNARSGESQAVLGRMSDEELRTHREKDALRKREQRKNTQRPS